MAAARTFFGHPRRKHRTIFADFTMMVEGVSPPGRFCRPGPLTRFCRPGPLTRFCRMAAATTRRHLQRHDPLGAQLGRRLTTDLATLLVLECPLATLGVEPDPDRPAGPHQPHRIRP